MGPIGFFEHALIKNRIASMLITLKFSLKSDEVLRKLEDCNFLMLFIAFISIQNNGSFGKLICFLFIIVQMM